MGVGDGRESDGWPFAGDVAPSGLAAAWPLADDAHGDHRRTELAGTRMVAAAGLDGPVAATAVAIARSGGAEATWSVVPAVADRAARGGWRRAHAGDGVASALVAALRQGRPLPGGFRLGSAPGSDPALDLAGHAEAPVGVDQTNESIVVGGRAVVKWLLHPDPARERAPRLLRHLAAVGFTEVPRVLGTLGWSADPAAATMTVAIVDAWLPGARDGWEWCVDAVLAHASRGHACDPASPAGFAPSLGDLVARLHLAFATPSSVIPDPVAVAGPEAISRWLETAQAALADAIALTAVDDPADGAELAAVAGMLGAGLAGLAAIDRTPVMHIHGDLHVGQVLAGPHGLAVVDLDGNPTADPVTALAPAPAARDVAGMLCSLDHVGRVAIRRGADPDVVEAWIDVARPAFLDAYRAALAAAGRPELLDERLLASFCVEQECRELIYAARFLPRWRYAPMGAIRAMVAR